MDALRIKKGEFERTILPEFKLSNIIELYEEVEQRVEHIEVEIINPRYQDSTNQNDKEVKMNALAGKMRDIKARGGDEDKVYSDFGKVMHIIGRLCIR